MQWATWAKWRPRGGARSLRRIGVLRRGPLCSASALDDVTATGTDGPMSLLIDRRTPRGALAHTPRTRQHVAGRGTVGGPGATVCRGAVAIHRPECLVSGIGAGLAVAVYRYHAGFAPGVREAQRKLVGGHPLQGLGLPDALGLTLAADLLIVLFVVFGSLMVRTIRSRARHRRLLNLLARESSDYPGTDLIEDRRPVAYCLPGRRPRIVISEGALRLLS